MIANSKAMIHHPNQSVLKWSLELTWISYTAAQDEILLIRSFVKTETG